jgi:CRP/FNR family transcriptional regulator
MAIKLSAVNDRDKSVRQFDPFKELVELGFCVDTLASLRPAIAETQLVRYAPKDTVYHEASDVEALYVIREGRIKLLNYLENGRTRIVRLHNRGSIIGLNGLMDEVHTHSAVAIDEVKVFQIPMHLIKTAKDEDPDAYCQLLEYWHQYLKIADAWITDFSTGAIRSRVARLIRFLVETDEATGSSEVTLLTVEEMAETLGVTPESVSRVMADLKRKNTLQAVEEGLPNHYWCDLKAIEREAVEQ